MLLRFDDNPYGTNCWMLAEGAAEAVVIDPGFDAPRVRGVLEAAGLRVVAVLATHGHLDHTGAAGDLCGDDVPFYIHEADRLALTDAEAWGSAMPYPEVAVKDVRTVTDGDLVGAAGFEFEVRHTPGHTPGSVCYRVRTGSAVVLTGDLVFAGSIGRSDFPNSSPADMERSLRWFLGLPDELDVLPGHGPPTTVGRERATNPFLKELS